MRLIKKSKLLQARLKNQKVLPTIFFTKLNPIGTLATKVKDFYDKTSCL